MTSCHAGFYDLKAVFLQVCLDIVVGSRMEVQEVFAYDQDLWLWFGNGRISRISSC